MFYLLLTTLAVLYFAYLWVNRRPNNFPPGPPCLPVVGSTPFLSGANFHFMMEQWRQQYGPVVGIMLGSVPAVAVVEPKAVFEVLRNDDFQARPNFVSLRDRTFGESLGIMFSDGPYWAEQRRFTMRNLKDIGFGKKSMEGLILEEAEVLVEEFRQGSPKEIQVSMLFVISVINVMWSVMAGVRHERNDEQFNRLLTMLNHEFRNGNSNAGGIANIFPSLRKLTPAWRKSHQTHMDLQAFITNSIREHEKTFDAENMRDFIDLYIKEMQCVDAGSTFHEKSLIAVCMDLFAAGAESSSNTLGFCMLYLVRHPDVQTRIHEELDKNVGRSRRVSLDDRHNLVYLEATLLEVMRINSIAPLTVPHCACRDTSFNGYFIPKNTMMMISLWSCLHDVAHWGDPQEFRPERHIDVDGKLIKDEYMVNFGVGKRVCLGEALARNTLFLFFATIMQELTITLPAGHDMPSIVPLSGFTVAPQPFQVVVTERV